MNHGGNTAARIEDKWIEFVAAEFGDHGRAALRNPERGVQAAVCLRRVEVRASYLWLFLGAVLAWCLR
jgi:hypothetical protein